MDRPFRFAVRVRAGARQDQAAGSWPGAAGPALLVNVTAAAVEGKANEAVRRVLAAAFGVRQRDVQIVSGERSRDKLIELAAPHADAKARLAMLMRSGEGA